MKGQLRIEKLKAFIMVDEDGSEGVMAALTPNGWLPLVGADEDRIKSVESMAQEICNQLGKTAVLAEFSVRTDRRHIEPNRLAEKYETERIGDSIIGITTKKKF